MTYEPFALKYRPRLFSDLVGQDPIAETLRNALKAGRIANAFLFAGSRGVGKTSAARILAKALNCPNASEGEPCATCEICVSIARGDDLDVIEIDGASNRGIDEIRAIRDNAGYKPSRCPSKVYIIDEVHMLTIQAFNALLKTLEEPPSHVRFIFATTEPQAVPETIVSRCQRYEFRRITPPDIVARLAEICAQEGVETEDGVLQEIALKAEGGMRDSTSLLDQAVTFSGGRVTLADLDKVLGRIDSELLEALLVNAGDGATGPLLDALDATFESGRDPEDVLAQLVDVFRDAMVREARGLEGGGEGRRAALVQAVRERFGVDRVLFALRVALNTRREIKFAGQGRLQLELALLKIARSQDLVQVAELLERVSGTAPAPRPAPAGRPGPGPGSGGNPPPWKRAPKGAGERSGDAGSRDAGPRAQQKPPAAKPPLSPAPEQAAAPTATAPAPAAPAPAAPTPAAPAPAAPTPAAPRSAPRPTLERVRDTWPKVVGAVRERSRQIGALLTGSEPETLDGDTLRVSLPAGQDFARQQLSGAHAALLREVVQSALGAPLRLVWELEAEQTQKRRTSSVYQDPSVRKLLDGFGGGLISVENEDPA